jgi:nondiscriminating aspartyl-tRNA synthetase
MQRILARETKNNIGKTITIQGWLHKKRLLGGLTFINVRDRSGLTQVVIDNKDEVEKLRGLQIGTIVSITGNVVEEKRAPGGAELHDATIEVNVPVTDEPPIEIDKPLSHKPDNLDTLFDNRVIGLRNLSEQGVFRIRSQILRNIRSFLYDQDFVEIQSPKIVAGNAEGGSEVFKLDYFGKEASLAQSPQLYKQMMVGVFERVFEIGPAFRAELSATTRHVSEVTMLDIEMGFIENHEQLLDFIQDMVYDTANKIYDEHKDILNKFNAPELKLVKKFPRYSVKEIHEMYSKATGENTHNDKDLSPAEERWICDYSKKKNGCEAVFATNLPIEAHKFYQMINQEDPSTVLSADLLFRGIELATCPMRENDYKKLTKQMEQKGIDPNAAGFESYLKAFKYGLPIHGGCGFGIDRFVEKLVGLDNVKEAILFPRDINRLVP